MQECGFLSLISKTQNRASCKMEIFRLKCMHSGQNSIMAHFQDFLPKPTSWLSQFVMGRTIDSVRRRMKSLLLRIPMNSAKFVQEAMHKDLKSLEDFLQDKLFLMGPKVSNVDCTVFAFLFICSIEEPQLLQQCSFGSMYPNCLRYVKTLSQLYYDKHNAYTTQNPDIFVKMAHTQ